MPVAVWVEIPAELDGRPPDPQVASGKLLIASRLEASPQRSPGKPARQYEDDRDARQREEGSPRVAFKRPPKPTTAGGRRRGTHRVRLPAIGAHYAKPRGLRFAATERSRRGQ